MALAININDLLNKQKIESNRIEFKKGWNPGSIYHSICAFANDFDDLGGGYIIVGVDTDDKTGMAIRPVEGVPMENIDNILQEMVSYNNKMTPYYLPRTSVEEVDGKQLIVIWCPAGSYRPYSVPVNVTAKGTKEYFYIRSGTSSIEARGEVLVELRELANRVPFDERGNSDIQLEDISLVLLRDYLVKVGSKLADDVITTPLSTILDQMELYTGPKENRLLRNVVAMMFCEHPSKFFPYTQIDVVTFPNGKMNDPNNFTEVTFKGSVPQMIKQTMDYIKSNVLKEHVRKISGRQEAERFWNYPYDAIEEAVVNSNSSETDILGSERSSETKTKSSERSSETKDLIIKQDPHITAAEIAMQLNMSSRGIEKQIRKLRELGKIKRTGGRFGGYWEIVILDKE